MTVSPKKQESNFTICTTNRGVEAKEVEIANVHLDTNIHPSSQRGHATHPGTDCSRGSRSPPSRDDSASYIQVLVQKQRRRRDISAPRLPQPSSPNAPSSPRFTKQLSTELNTAPKKFQYHGKCFKNGNSSSKQGDCVVCKMWPESLLACPAIAALHQSCGTPQETTFERKGNIVSQSRRLGTLPVQQPNLYNNRLIRSKTFTCHKNNGSLWQKVRSITKENVESQDGPERLDIYRFETGLATLIARGAAPTHLERLVRRKARPGGRLLAEALVVPQLLAELPAALLLLVLRTALTPVRDMVVGLVQTVSDFALKPTLALAFNALLQPTLSCAMQTARALRATVRPLAMTLNDATEPVARLLAAVRLVHVERRCGCTHSI